MEDPEYCKNKRIIVELLYKEGSPLEIFDIKKMTGIPQTSLYRILKKMNNILKTHEIKKGSHTVKTYCLPEEIRHAIREIEGKYEINMLDLIYKPSQSGEN